MSTFKTETITPHHAMEILKGNTHNRNINKRHVQSLADSMKRGEWHLNGEAIKLNGTRVLDGQHRLEACILAGKSFKTFVIRGLRNEVQNTIDTGLSRTNQNHFEMIGETHCRLLAQTITKVIGYYGDWSKTGNIPKPKHVSNIQAANFLNENAGVRELVHHHGSIKQNIFPRALAAACHFIFEQINSEAADEFMARAIDGTGLEKKSPILSLRNKFIADFKTVSPDRKLTTISKYALIIKAWNIWRDNGQCTNLVWRRSGQNPEKFPTAK